MAINLPETSPGSIGTSPFGAGLTTLSELLQQFLQMQMGVRERSKDRQARAQELADQRKLDEQRIGLEQKRIGLEEQGQRMAGAKELRSSISGGMIDDPELAAKLQEAFKGTPYEATIQSRGDTLPSTRVSPIGAAIGATPSAGFGDVGSTQSPGKPSFYLQPTDQERKQMEQDKRDQFLMEMERKREEREAAEAPMRQKVLEHQATTSSPEYLDKKMKEQHNFDLEDIRARIRAMSQTGKKTSFDDDIRTFINGMKAVDSITDPADAEVAQTALMAFLQAMKQKYPEMRAAVPPPTGNQDVGKLPDVPGATSGPGMMERFLSGVKGMFSAKGPSCPDDGQYHADPMWCRYSR